MNSNVAFGLFAWLLLVACSGESTSVRHRFQNAGDDAAVAAPTVLPAPEFALTRAELRPLSKVEIQNSLQDMFLLPSPPDLDGFVEQSSKTQIFRNSYDSFNDSSSLPGLRRDISTVVESLDLRQLANALVGCDAVEALECRSRLVTRIATHAFRRPLTDDERTNFQKQAAESLKLPVDAQSKALAHLLAQLTFDPRFLFRSELGAEAQNAAATYPLAAWEKLATITFNLSHRPPSYEQIQSLADFDKDPDRWNQTIDALIQSPAVAGALANMFSEWLMYYGLENMDIQGDPNWTKAKAHEQLSATQRFLLETYMQDDTLRALVAKPNAENDGYGIFSSKAFLTSTSKNGQGSMILRGVRIIRQALCQPLGIPPGTVEAAPPKDLSPQDPNYDIKLTLQHGSRPNCVGCHRLIDPAGLALHAFNGFGVNTNAQVDFQALAVPSQVTVSLNGQVESIATGSSKEFAQSLANSSTFAHCFSRHALRSIVGRDLTDKDIVSADLLADQYLKANASGKESLREFFRAIMSSEQIYLRTR